MDKRDLFLSGHSELGTGEALADSGGNHNRYFDGSGKGEGRGDAIATLTVPPISVFLRIVQREEARALNLLLAPLWEV